MAISFRPPGALPIRSDALVSDIVDGPAIASAQYVETLTNQARPTMSCPVVRSRPACQRSRSLSWTLPPRVAAGDFVLLDGEWVLRSVTDKVRRSRGCESARHLARNRGRRWPPPR